MLSSGNSQADTDDSVSLEVVKVIQWQSVAEVLAKEEFSPSWGTSAKASKRLRPRRKTIFPFC
jgi:hypothetical protein